MKINNKLKKLSKTELQYMNEIWNNPDGITSDEIYSKFDKAKGTKSTILHRIFEKGYVEFTKKGKKCIYTAKISKDEYEDFVMNQTMEKLKGILPVFFNRETLTESELARIKDFLEELKNE